MPRDRDNYNAWMRARRARVKATETPEQAEIRKTYFRERARARYRRLRDENPEKIRAAARLTRRKCVGIENATDATASGACEICLETFDKLCMDHDHKTGKIRGWLCTRCNLGLGSFKDSPGRLDAAKAYLEKFNAPVL